MGVSTALATISRSRYRTDLHARSSAGHSTRMSVPATCRLSDDAKRAQVSRSKREENKRDLLTRTRRTRATLAPREREREKETRARHKGGSFFREREREREREKRDVSGTSRGARRYRSSGGVSCELRLGCGTSFTRAQDTYTHQRFKLENSSLSEEREREWKPVSALETTRCSWSAECLCDCLCRQARRRRRAADLRFSKATHKSPFLSSKASFARSGVSPRRVTSPSEARRILSVS